MKKPISRVMRSQGLFLVFILMLTIGLLSFNQKVRDHYSDRKDLQNEIVRLEKAKERQALRESLLENQIQDLQASVFQTLGQQTALTLAQKQWWAGLRAPASIPIEPQSAMLMSQAKEKFRDKEFEKSVEILQTLIQRYPTSKDIVEAHFLLAESLFLSGQTEQSLDMIDTMMTRYPESELTGFIMLRMGQILEKRNRTADAREVYDTIQNQFPKSPELQGQIQQLKRRPASR